MRYESLPGGRGGGSCPDVAIVGGGVAGLTCAAALAAHDIPVTLLEAGDILGGRARSWTDAATGDRVDIGPHVLFSEYRNFLKLLEMLGTADRVVWRRDGLLTLSAPDYRTVIRLYRLPPPAHLMPSMLRAPGVSVPDVLSTIPLSHTVAKMTEEDLLRLDDRSAYDFIRDMKVSPRFIAWFWAATSMAIMNVPLEKCSAAALMRFYLQAMARSDLRMGFAGGGLGDLFAGPAARFLEMAGGQIRLGTRAAALHPQEQGIGLTLAHGEAMVVRDCVVALPPAETAALLPSDMTRPRGDDLRAFQPSPYISTYLWFDRKVTTEQGWLRLWRPDNLHYDFYDLSNIRIGRDGRGSLIAGNIIYSHNANDMSDDAIIEAAIREIAELAPAAAEARVTHAAVHRIPMAIPCPYPGMERLRPETETDLSGVFLAGDWTRTSLPSSMESAARSGWLAAEAVLRRRGVAASLALPSRRVGGVIGAARALLNRPLRIPPVN